MKNKIITDLDNLAVNLKNEISIDENSDSIIERYGFDSLEFMEFITAIEKEFDIEFRDDIEFERLNNINSLIEEIQKEQCSH